MTTVTGLPNPALYEAGTQITKTIKGVSVTYENIGGAWQRVDFAAFDIKSVTLPVHADNAAALTAELSPGDWYSTPAGVVMITLAGE